MYSNGLVARLRRQTVTATVVGVVKEDTDWQASYHFRLNKGCWRLWKYEDKSL